MPYRLRVEQLREVASKHGDQTTYAIAKRCGINETALGRLLNGKTKPGVKTLLNFRRAYGKTLDELIEETAA
jgi:transcriptional regulator with XRE-family HTH domain